MCGDVLPAPSQAELKKLEKRQERQEEERKEFLQPSDKEAYY
jgi:hypothetical protein